MLFFKFTCYLFDCFWILITILRGRYHYSYFTNDKTGAQSNKEYGQHHRACQAGTQASQSNSGALIHDQVHQAS